MAKQIDDNGFWLIEGNPISKEGVFPYLGKTISPKLEPNRIYQVYRPYAELSSPETLKSFDGIPFIEDHEMLGDGFTSTDTRTPKGVLMNPRAENGGIFGDLKIFSDSMKSTITNGKKELSLGYRCNYRLEPGVWNGQPYEVVQTDLRGNHIALVDKGRMGSSVRVYDWAFDALDIEREITNTNNNKENGAMPDEKEKDKTAPEAAADEAVDKRKLIDGVAGFLKDKGLSDEDIRFCIGKMEKMSYDPSEAGKATDADDKPEDKEGDEKKPEAEAADKCGKDACGKDEDAEKKGEEKTAEGEKAEDGCGKGKDEFFDGPKMDELIERMKNEGKISAEAAKELQGSRHYERAAESSAKNEAKREETGAKKSGMDAADYIREMDKRDALYNAVTPIVGEFDKSGMTEVAVARYACDKLDLKPETDAEALGLAKGYAAAKAAQSKTYSMDAAPETQRAHGGMSERIKRYLAEGK